MIIIIFFLGNVFIPLELVIKTEHYSQSCLGIFFPKKSDIIPLLAREEMEEANFALDGTIFFPTGQIQAVFRIEMPPRFFLRVFFCGLFFGISNSGSGSGDFFVLHFL